LNAKTSSYVEVNMVAASARTPAAAVREQIRRITGYAGPDEDLDAAWCSAFRPDPEVIGLLARRPAGRQGFSPTTGRWKRRS
jgi:hypothetical protein